jgi:hypothetical protein
LSLELKVIDDHSLAPQEFRILEPANLSTYITHLSKEYCNLRTECAASIDSVNVEGIGVVDTEKLHSFLVSKTIPDRIGGNFDVVRSDMGETAAYSLLEREYNTVIGYKGVRDRELSQLTGRGIDVIGIENNNTFTLLLGEAKVSSENRNPPRVVDDNEDSISKSLESHISNHSETSKKIWDVARHIRDNTIAQQFFTAAIYWDDEMWTEMDVVCCGVLVRPKEKCNENDFGLLRATPDIVAPGTVRFIIVCFDEDLEEVVSTFHSLAKQEEEASNG